MSAMYGSEQEEMIVGIGPSIGPCCYEVNGDIKKEFNLSFNDDIIAKVVKAIENKYYIDLWEANKLTLIENGIKGSLIETSECCTKCNSERFFSHRNMGVDRGSQVAIMVLK
jgi:hypothetical protein